MFVRCVAVLVLSILSISAKAETTSIELGWTKIPPCTKVTLNPFKLITGEQRLYGYVEIDTNKTAQEVAGVAPQCANSAMASCGGLKSILVAPGQGAACMAPDIASCFAKNAIWAIVNAVHIRTRTQCFW